MLINRLRLLLFLLLTLSGIGSLSAWEVVKYDGRDYVTASSMRTFYAFQTLKSSGKYVTLENSAYSVRFTANQQECLMNKVKFVLSYPTLKRGDKLLISRLDLVKIIDPVLRPSYIRTGRAFQTVILDPGHGGKDPGAVNSYGTEKYYNLKLAKKLKPLLEKRGFKVIMTRSDDTFLTLQERVNLANRHSNAIFVSLHFNAGQRSARGIETFTLSPAGTASTYRRAKGSDANQLRGNSQDSANIALATAIHGLMQRRSGTFDRGIKRARYSVLTGVKHPAVLIEGGFLSHPYEAKLIHSETYMTKLASSISDGILKYRMAISR